MSREIDKADHALLCGTPAVLVNRFHLSAGNANLRIVFTDAQHDGSEYARAGVAMSRPDALELLRVLKQLLGESGA